MPRRALRGSAPSAAKSGNRERERDDQPAAGAAARGAAAVAAARAVAATLDARSAAAVGIEARQPHRIDHELQVGAARLARVVAEVDRLHAAGSEVELAERLPAVDRGLIEHDGVGGAGVRDDVLRATRLRVRRGRGDLDAVAPGLREVELPGGEARLDRG